MILKQIIWPEFDDKGNLITEIKIQEPIYYIGVQAFPGTVLDFGAAGKLTINSTGIFEFHVPNNMTINELTINLSAFTERVNNRIIVDYLTEESEAQEQE